MALPPRRPALLRGGTVLTMDRRHRVVQGDVLLRDGRIAAIGQRLRAPRGAELVDCRDSAVLPGLIQAHVHLCQVLFRNHADGLVLLDWLRRRIWPFEAAHDARSLRFSAQLGIAELLLGGTTAILDMATVRYTEEILRAALESGIRYSGGKVLMDAGPPGLRERTDDALAETERLGRRWHGAAEGRLRWALCPRFVLSCSERLLREVAAMSRREGWLVHTHASENWDETRLVRKLVGQDNAAYFHALGLSGPNVVLAHCVHLTAREEWLLARTRTHAVHCPGANLKLASGIAPVPRLLERGVNVALGGDGAPCNNTLDAFHEMRLAATLHLPRFGPTSLPAATVLDLATRRGARALGLEDEIGSLEVGKRADVVVVDLKKPHLSPQGDDPHATIVYGARASDVTYVYVDGRRLVARGALQTLDAASLSRDAAGEARRLMRRARAARAATES
ncbi:MAG: 5'-deoxyadenosine deaminase [Deltaproteobacteria bacterium]